MKQLVLTYGLMLCVLALTAQNNLPSESIFEALQYDKAVDVIIKTDLDSLINVRKRLSYQQATFIYTNKNGKEITQKLKVRPRGKYRRRVCDFPTIKINFSKKALKAKGMAKYDDYKLVTHCLDDRNISKENVLREYLVYRLYNLLAEESFQVQFLNITYRDNKNPKKQLKRTGFLIEDTEELADRIGVEIMQEPKLPMDSFDLEQYNFVALFQYMVGNIDWKATPFAKNMKVMKQAEKPYYELIPYDFDFSGLVGVSYQRLAEHLGQKDARQRIFLGNSKDPSDLKENFQRFEAKKTVLLEYISNFDLLSKQSRKNIKKYVASFYDDIADGELEGK